MAEELGRIEKPQAEQFGEGRKLYLVPLLYQGTDSPPEYLERYDLYWQQAKEHVANLESGFGKVKHIYHELIALAGDDGLKVIERLNPGSHRITQEKCEDEAQLEATEDRELVEETMDWERCLLFGFMSEKVARTVAQFYAEASKNRYEHIARRIDETLGAGETAILFIREGHGVQFPGDMQVFHVSPPALDQIHRWLRDRSREREESEG